MLMATAAQAQPYVPPDFYSEPYKNPIGWFANQGQLINENGQPRSDIKFSSVGCVPKACLAKNSQVYFLTYEHGATPADPVTVMQVSMRPVGKARKVDPQGVAVKDWYQNFYLPQTAPAGASQVPGYSRVIYEGIYNAIDMHFYSGSGGQKMSFVMRPGANPSDLQLLFTGQDSLKVDLWGNLKVYYNGQYYILPQAVAYQVGTGNSIIPVNWTATYSLVSGGGVVKFNFSTYNPALPLVFQVGALPSTTPPNTENLCWSTYLGGTNGDQVNASTVDEAGNFFVTGYSLSDFLTIPDNQGMALINGGQVIILAFFDPDYHLQWLTYYGASGTDQQANAVVTRGSGTNERVYIAGYTTGANLYPKVEAGAYNLKPYLPGTIDEPSSPNFA